jgi:hypothetical protein
MVSYKLEWVQIKVLSGIVENKLEADGSTWVIRRMD